MFRPYSIFCVKDKLLYAGQNVDVMKTCLNKTIKRV